MRVDLKFTSGEFAGTVVAVPLGTLIVGRAEDCDLRPKSRHVSRRHCVFKLDEYTARVYDLGSRNGTHVNGVEARGEVVLSDGDQVRFGDMGLTVSIRPDASPPSEPLLPETLGPPAEGDTQFFGDDAGRV